MKSIEELVDFIATLPGLGPRSAKRIFFAMMREKKRMMYRFVELLQTAYNSIVDCEECGGFDVVSPCNICSGATRDRSKICIVTEVGDLWSIEASGHYDGLYHCLGGVLSAGRDSYRGIDTEKLIGRILRFTQIAEVIIATGTTIEEQTTAFFLIDHIKDATKRDGRNVSIAVLGQGMPIGSELDYLDEGTIGAAFRGRKEI